MIDLSVFLALCVIVVIANIVALPKLLDYSNLYPNHEARSIERISTISKSIVLSLGACAVGAYMAPRVGLGAPFLHELLDFSTPIPNLWNPLRIALVNSFYVLLGLLLLNVAFVQRHLTTARYFSMPLQSKVLMEGVVEEVVYRWGLMSVVARISVREFNVDPNTAMILAILLAAVGSSLSHVSDLARLHFDRISMALLAVILINFWASLCYGWLFWQHGLTTAILCHALVVLISTYAYKISHLSFDLQPENP
ncbi:MAG TPA: CPBP family glutamic-type intramembrane protease [Spongiibacteraceae bacterium]|nr:CPBP family glutamic-type intramembrane protease [Spongiibacteraceae bacterium]